MGRGAKNPDNPKMISGLLPTGKANSESAVKEGRVWKTRKQTAEIFGTLAPAIDTHIAGAFAQNRPLIPDPIPALCRACNDKEAR